MLSSCFRTMFDGLRMGMGFLRSLWVRVRGLGVGFGRLVVLDGGRRLYSNMGSLAVGDLRGSGSRFSY